MIPSDMEGLLALLLALPLLAAQEKPTQDEIRALVEKLRSDNVEAREEAVQKLKELGESAISALEVARKASDAELAARAGYVARFIRIRKELSPTLRKAIPGIVDRLAQGEPRAWFEVFREAVSSTPRKRRKYPELEPSDLDLLAVRALRSAATPKEKKWAVRAARQSGSRAAFREILRLLEAEEPSVRATVCEVLAWFGDGEATSQIAAHIEDESPIVRRNAIFALRKLGAGHFKKRIRLRLSDQNAKVRMQAAFALGALGDTEAVLALRQRLEDQDDDVRWAAIRALSRLRAKEAIPEILRRLEDKSGTVRDQAVQALAELDAEKAALRIVKCLEDDHSSSSAQDALARLDVRGVIPKITLLLRHPDDKVRKQAGWTLEAMGAIEAAPKLVDFLGEDDPELQETVLYALGGIGATDAVPDVARLLSYGDERVRAAATVALGELGATERVPALIKLLSDPSSKVRYAAVGALGMLDSRRSARKILPLLKDKDILVAAQAAETLQGMNPTDLATDVAEILDERGLNTIARMLVLNTLRLIGNPEHIPRMKRFLKSPDPLIQGAAAGAIAELGDKQVLPTLRDMLDRDDPVSRRSAVQALGKLGSREAMSLLIEALNDADNSVRSWALQALGRLEVKEAIPAIRPLLQIPFIEGSKAAKVLCQLGSREGVRIVLQSGDPDDHFCLNTLRRPVVWKTLRDHVFENDVEGPRRKVLQRLAAKAEMAVAVPKHLRADRDRWLDTFVRVHPRRARVSFLDALREVIAGGDFHVIFERDRVVLMPEEDGLRFWKAWWKEEREKKK